MLYLLYGNKSYILTLDINTLSNGIRWILSSNNICNSYLICPYGTGTIVPCQSWCQFPTGSTGIVMGIGKLSGKRDTIVEVKVSNME